MISSLLFFVSCALFYQVCWSWLLDRLCSMKLLDMDFWDMLLGLMSRLPISLISSSSFCDFFDYSSLILLLTLFTHFLFRTSKLSLMFAADWRGRARQCVSIQQVSSKPVFKQDSDNYLRQTPARIKDQKPNASAIERQTQLLT